MTKTREISVFSIVMTAVTVLLLGFIFGHSMMTADVSAKESGLTLSFLMGFCDFLGIPVSLSDFIVRKAAHFAEFALLGIFTVITFYSYFKKAFKYILSELFICLAAAVTDETIQLFVPGRSGQITDVLVDFFGSLAGILIIFLVLLLIKSIKSKKLTVN